MSMELQPSFSQMRIFQLEDTKASKKFMIVTE